jgi:nicotinate-nucleotide adenylyltransferase
VKIGIYGGSFNPPHLGHLAAARAAVAALELDKLVWIPAGCPPHKELAANSPTAEQRLEMTEIAADQLLLPGITQVWDVEIRREGKSYTADTLRQAAQRWPEAELWLLMGTDMFLTLHRWHKPEQILALAGVCAFGRTEADGEEVFAPQREFLRKAYPEAKIATITIPGLVDISSTRLRELLAQGKGREFLPEAVYGYLLRETLYGTHADLKHLSMEDLRCVSYSMVKAKRLAHIRGIEEEAAKLARRWGADERRMRRAAILHDCTKYLSREEHLAICDRYGVELDPLERATDKLLHAKSGAALAKHIFGEDDIYDAILYHTTARAEMSLEEKLLYIADYMEPCRDFPEVGELRRLAYADLDGAVGMGASLSMQEMVQRGKELHHDTLGAYEFYGKGNKT